VNLAATNEIAAHAFAAAIGANQALTAITGADAAAHIGAHIAILPALIHILV